VYCVVAGRGEVCEFRPPEVVRARLVQEIAIRALTLTDLIFVYAFDVKRIVHVVLNFVE
jgi:hypothetical protein